MFPFFWPTEVKFPGADGNFQTISPASGWFSTTVNYKGSPEIEQRVANEIASNGKQLGIITEAVLELAGSKNGEKLDRLRDLNARIAEIKERTLSQMRREARDTLEALARRDKDEARQVAEQMLKQLS
ncbi:hypothetical protein C8N35_102165 [Breoghania corrubedonensis]|uniref:Uncharacterized protein n=1 Tax=Breoghania corrubedonensis TaxID=665038 RepID=A0A2T5VCJ5_9HYPH|nr:hypothetical protein [Breoghania corrubedonensis]PTW61455.1 hypothetical protein C8N35_102165 [Breoghania corrubedonensis]